MSRGRAVRSPRGPADVFLGTGLLSLLAGAMGLAANPRLLLGPFYQFPILGLTHVFTLGWISSFMIGVLLRITPMTLGIRPRGRGLGFTVYSLWILGASGVAMHMGRGEWFGVWTAAICSLAAALLLVPLNPGLVGRAREGDWTARYALAGIGHLVLAAGLGCFAALNHQMRWVDIPPYRLLAAHLHLAEVGWVTVFILGFGRKLLPPLAPAREREPWESRLRFAALETGLLGLVVSLLALPAATPIFAGVLGAALLWHLAPLLGRLARGRIRDRSSFWAVMAATAGLGAVLAGLLLAGGAFPRMGVSQDRGALAYGVLSILGWNTLAIAAFAHKLLPMWVWQERFGGRLGESGLPAMQSLYGHATREGMGAGLLLGTLCLAAGILLGQVSLITCGAWIFALGVLLFLANVLRLLL